MHERLALAARGRAELAAAERNRLRSTRPEALLSYFEVKTPKRAAALRLDSPFFVIGRSERIPIFHDDQSISREHAAVVVKRTGIRVRDLGSKNGVALNGALIGKYAEVDVKPGDLLQLGATLLVLREGEPKLRRPVPVTAEAAKAGPASVALAVPPSGATEAPASAALAVPPSGKEAAAPAKAPQVDDEPTVALRDEDEPPKLAAAGDFVPDECVEEVLTTQETEAPAGVADTRTPPSGDETEDLTKTQDSTALPALDPGAQGEKKDDKPIELA